MMRGTQPRQMILRHGAMRWLVTGSVVAMVGASCGPPPTPKVKPKTGKVAAEAIEPQFVAGRGRDTAPLCKVPAGPFLRGSRQGKGEPDESPQRTIELDTFYIDRFAVSVAQYRKCVEAKVCDEPEPDKECNYQESKRGQHPINCVSWNMANDYCHWAGKRLPTEAEWEKAARGVDGRLFPWGNKEPNCTLANFYKRKENRYCRSRTVAVHEYKHSASPYGAVQMAGNTYEWVNDWYGKDTYSMSDRKNPGGPALGKYRVVRGGSWFSPALDLRSVLRGPLPPVMRLNYLGFRCAVSRLTDMEKAPKKRDKTDEDKGEVVYDTHFGYSADDDTGPQHWGDLKPAFAACKEGKAQSPIDIVRAAIKPSGGHKPLTFSYAASSWKIIDTGHTIKVTPGGKQEVTIRGKAYRLVQLHFHAKSENKRNGKHYPMEMHLVHKSEQGELAVVGVWIDGKAKKDHPEFAKIWARFPDEQYKETKVSRGEVNPGKLLPADLAYFNWPGSLTTPPCTEGVDWNMLQNPVHISPAQLKAFVAKYDFNNRPVQPLNKRKVISYK